MKNALKTLQLTTVVTLTFMFSGCVTLHNIARQTGGRQSSQLLLESANKVKKGMTMTDVRAIIGKPAAITENNGRQTWVYSGDNVFTASSFRKTETASVMIQFNPSGRVSNVNRNRIEQGPILMY